MIDLFVREDILTRDGLEAGLAANEDADGFGRFGGKLVGLDLLACLVPGLRVPDHADEVVEIAERNEEGLEFLGVLLGFAQQVTGPSQDDLAAVLDVADHRVLQIKEAWAAMIDREHVDRKGRLERSVFVEIVENDLGTRVALEINDDAGVFIGLIAHRADLGKDLCIRKFRDALDESGTVHCVGNLGDDDLLAALGVFEDAGTSTHFDTASSGAGIVVDAAIPEECSTSGREIGAFHIAEELFNRNVRIIDRGTNAVDDFPEVVGRQVRCHAHSDPGAAVDEQIRKSGREHNRLALGFVVVRDVVDRVLLHVGHEDMTEVSETGFGVTHRSRRIAFNRSEVPLPINEDVPHRPGLGHVDEGWINRGFTVWVVVTGSITTNLGTFPVIFTGSQIEVIHCQKNSSL